MSEVPTRIGRYEIARELGRGMMGVVYQARDSVLDRMVALKTIQLAFSVSENERESFEERFFTEARSAARLSHPGIVVVHDVGREAETGTLFMALEYLEGRPLSALVHEGSPMDWREALRIVAGIAESLHHAHAAGVVHRDIKPANIMVLDSGEPKVMDFGLAKLQTSQAKLTSTGQFFGTPLYMSPEQALGKPMDGRSDLFSLGALAYELVTGRCPFIGDSIPLIFTKVAHDNPTPPTLLNPELPPGVDEIIARALAKDPADRYRDGGQLAEDVEDVLAGRLPRHRAAGAMPAGTGAPASPAAPGGLGQDLDAAFSTLVTDGAAAGGPRATVRSARGRLQEPAPTRAARSRWSGRQLAVGIGMLVLGVGSGAVVLRSRAPETAPAVPATRAASPSADSSEAAGQAGSTPPPAPATLPAAETDLFARAVAAHLGGDLESSEELLRRLLRRNPEFPRADSLLQQVEAELWAREGLPLQFRAEHNHRFGSCRGQLTLDAQGVEYASHDHGLWRWGFEEIREMTRKGLRELDFVTSEREALRLGGSKRYRFTLTSDGIERDDWSRFARLAQGDQFTP